MFVSKRIAHTFSDYANSKSVGTILRSRRISPLLEIIHDVYNKKGHVSIADIGGTEEYWNIVPKKFLYDNLVTITLMNLPGCLKQSGCELFKYVNADACDLSFFKNNFFDIAHSNSVIEHVGDWSRMTKFANEIQRIAPNYFIQTPNYWFPVEPHCMTLFFHWLPRPTKIWLVMRFQLGNWNKAASVNQAARDVDRIRLLNKKMLKSLFADAEIVTEKLCLLPKSFIAIKKG